jgi:hypothetical protein
VKPYALFLALPLLLCAIPASADDIAVVRLNRALFHSGVTDKPRRVDFERTPSGRQTTGCSSPRSWLFSLGRWC